MNFWNGRISYYVSSERSNKFEFCPSYLFPFEEGWGKSFDGANQLQIFPNATNSGYDRIRRLGRTCKKRRKTSFHHFISMQIENIPKNRHYQRPDLLPRQLRQSLNFCVVEINDRYCNYHNTIYGNPSQKFWLVLPEYAIVCMKMISAAAVVDQWWKQKPDAQNDAQGRF